MGDPIIISDAIVAPLARTSGISRRVDARDEALAYASDADGAARAEFEYIRLGRDAADVVEQIVAWAFPDGRSIDVLEFACGYGRIVRHLVARFGADCVTASDIDADAVAFVAQEFGVDGKVSVAEPEQLAWTERFGLIVVPSLFSHLPDATFGRWVAALYRLLLPDGVLVFSVHGDHLPDAGDVDGIRFLAVSETRGRLDPGDYGTAYVTEAYVAARIAELPGRPPLARVERGFWDHQDLYVVSGPGRRDAVPFVFDRPILGHVDRIDLAEPTGPANPIDDSGEDSGQSTPTTGRVATVLGWALSTEPGLAVEVVIGEQVVAATSSMLPSLDVASVRGAGFERCRYEIHVDLTDADDEDILVVRAHDDRRDACFYAQPVRAALAVASPQVMPPTSWRSTVRSIARRALTTIRRTPNDASRM